MIRSMTAFARAGDEGPWGSAVCELRSVNHRYLELAIRLPETLTALEMPLRDFLRQHVSRGKVECVFRYQPLRGEVALAVNLPLAESIVAAARQIALQLTGVAALNPM